jgi:hypothetical protein
MEKSRLKIVTDKNNKEYVLQGFVVGGYYLISYDGSKYWEHFNVPKSEWLPMDKLDYDLFNITKEEFNIYKINKKKITDEILNKYQNSF